MQKQYSYSSTEVSTLTGYISTLFFTMYTT
jgi:hypothetical protein